MNSSAWTALVCASIVFMSWSRAEAMPVDLSLRMQMGVGGDEIASIAYSDGSQSDLRLGTYFQLGAGGLLTPLRNELHALELEAFAGWASWATGPENTDDRLTLGRLPLELLARYRVSPKSLPVALFVGGGVAYHLIGGVSGSGSLEGKDLDVANGLGWVAELGVVHDDIFTFGLRYTRMSYTVGSPGLVMDASSVSGALGVLFPLSGAS